MAKYEHMNTTAPVCPHCDHEFSADDMSACSDDLWALAPNEGQACIECPACAKEFHVQGSYRPQYTTAIDEDDL